MQPSGPNGSRRSRWRRWGSGGAQAGAPAAAGHCQQRGADGDAGEWDTILLVAGTNPGSCSTYRDELVSFLKANGSRDAMAGRGSTVAQNVALLSVQGHALLCFSLLLLRPACPTIIAAGAAAEADSGGARHWVRSLPVSQPPLRMCRL